MRILLDTNILVSGILVAGSPPARLLDLWRARRFELVTGDVQLRELERVLARPRIAQRLLDGEASALLMYLRREARWVHDLPVVDASPDPDDNLLLATAVAGRARWIVSGDRGGMLALQNVAGITILTARDAVERLDPRRLA